jgi:hypothetical protein
MALYLHTAEFTQGGVVDTGTAVQAIGAVSKVIKPFRDIIYTSGTISYRA